ncbi:amino acid deaminase [Microbacterium sp. PMB16]|uniref:amino acid deaminase n=1 Tax=Microbacterium sp. PMB16 TaxID=3120157 RepID=UPI003F4AFC47
MAELRQLTLAASAAADGSIESARTALDALPWLDSSIRDDRSAGGFDAWGLSTAIDENTGSAVITPTLFEELHRRAGIAATWPIGNAGLVHCYGYLLSLEVTPYGLKRERWIDGALALACGLPTDGFLPWRAGPTLLARAVAAASAVLESPAIDATRVIDGRETRVAVAAAEGPTALAYAVAPSPGARPQLVTMFPVAEAAAPLESFADDARLRWNAV